MTTPRPLTVAKVVISLIALMTAVSPFLAHFNETHVCSPQWPPHARFHNGQTMTLGLIAGLLPLWLLWVRKGATALENLKMGTLFTLRGGLISAVEVSDEDQAGQAEFPS